jgi:hypothetical protein
MKHKNKFIVGGILIAAFNLAIMTGCVGGYVAAGGPGYYGDGGWVDGTVIVGGGGWYGDHRDGAYVHPDFHGGGRR